MPEYHQGVSYTPEFVSQVREAYLSGHYASIIDIAKYFGISRQTIHTWRKEEDWDGQLLKIRQAADRLITYRLAEEKSTLNQRHKEIWCLFEQHVREALTEKIDGVVCLRKNLTHDSLYKLCMCFKEAQRGQRVILNLDVPDSNETTITSIRIDYPGLKSLLARGRVIEASGSGSGSGSNGQNGNGSNGNNTDIDDESEEEQDDEA